MRHALVAAVLLALAAGTPAAALDAEYDGVYGLVASTHGRGAFIIDFIHSDDVRVTTALKGLKESAEYRLILSKARCGHANTPDKEVMRTTFLSDANGAAYRAEVVPWLWAAVAPVPRSARLRRTSGGPIVCVRADAFSRLGHSSGGGNVAGMEYARFWDGGRRGLVILDRLDGDSGRLSWSLTGLSPGTYRLTGATVGCAQGVNAADRLYSVTFGPDILGNAVGNQDIAVENDETHWVGSDRIKRVGGNPWACRNAFVTDLIIDPFNP